MHALSLPILSLLPLLHIPLTAARAQLGVAGGRSVPLTLTCNTSALLSACTANPILASCPASSSSSAPGAAVNVPGFNGVGYQCEENDLESTKVATESVCFCQCQCQIEEEATTSEEAEAGVMGEDGSADGGGSAVEGGEVPAGFRGSGSMTTVASSSSVAASTTAPATTTTTSAAVAQLGPHAGFERRRFAH